MTTGYASNVSATGATLSATFSGASSSPTEVGFEYGTASDNLNKTLYVGMGSGSSGSFSGDLTSLESNTTYYYRAYVIIGNTKYFFGSVRSFQTGEATAPAEGTFAGWLELPGGNWGSRQYPKYWGTGKSRNYSYLYDKSMYTSMWVAYPLHPSHYGGSGSGSWKADPHFSESEQINIWSGSYGVSVGSTIYARGHQIPNGDRNNTAGQSQTYYATNSTPQIQDTFNGSIWNNLENGVRSAVTAYQDTVYIATGPAFEKVGESETITWIQPAKDTKICPVPNYYWKVLLKVQRNGTGITKACAIGFWYEHREYTKNEASNWANYAVSVDDIEQWTGFDFFANLPDDVEATAENNANWNTFRSF